MELLQHRTCLPCATPVSPVQHPMHQLSVPSCQPVWLEKGAGSTSSARKQPFGFDTCEL